MTQESAYGLWSLVLINSLVFIIFAFSFAKPQTKRDWRSFSAFSAFIVALFVDPVPEPGTGRVKLPRRGAGARSVGTFPGKRLRTADKFQRIAASSRRQPRASHSLRHSGRKLQRTPRRPGYEDRNCAA
jgi:hypothetical protein